MVVWPFKIFPPSRLFNDILMQQQVGFPSNFKYSV